VRYEIIFSPEAEEDIACLKSSDRAKALDTIETFLRYEPENGGDEVVSRIREKRGMKQVSIDEVKNDLSGYLQVAETESVVITRDGQPVGILIGLEDAEDWWEELMLRDPRFEAEIAQARQSLKEGKSISIEEMKAKYTA
jgi:prevent-host-death family protein